MLVRDIQQMFLQVLFWYRTGPDYKSEWTCGWLYYYWSNAGYIDQSDSSSQRNLYWDFKLLQPAPSNIKPCNYKHDNRKCTEAGINSRITVPSKVHASQDPTKQKNSSSKSAQRVVRLGWGLASVPSSKQVLFVYNWSKHSAVPVSTKTP